MAILRFGAGHWALALRAGLCALLGTGLMGCDIGQTSDLDPIEEAPPIVPEGTLRDAASTVAGKFIGAAVDIKALGSEPIYKETLAREFNYVTPENAMKWRFVEPSAGAYTFAEADTLVDFAEANGARVKGHALVWYQELPGFIDDSIAPDDLRAAMIAHIKGVVSHYKGRVAAWDVVNEAVADDWDTMPGEDGLRNSIFLQKLGKSYILDAFKAAREADPDAILIYNDYAGEGLNKKSDRIYALVDWLISAGAPIDEVGLQMHLEGWSYPPVSTMGDNIERLAALGLTVNISEMDVQMRKYPGTTAQKLEAQADAYKKVVGLCVSEPACTAVTFWGFTDAHSWIPWFFNAPDEAPLLFDKEYTYKLSFIGVEDALLKR